MTFAKPNEIIDVGSFKSLEGVIEAALTSYVVYY